MYYSSDDDLSVDENGNDSSPITANKLDKGDILCRVDSQCVLSSTRTHIPFPPDFLRKQLGSNQGCIAIGQLQDASKVPTVLIALRKKTTTGKKQKMEKM